MCNSGQLSHPQEKIGRGGSTNRTIHTMLERNELEKCKVRPISLSYANDISVEMLTKMGFQIKEKECNSTEYYFQDYKRACAIDYESLLQFLRTKKYGKRGGFSKDIDITMGYAGSFNREVIHYMVTNHNFRCQGAVEDMTKTILDNSDKV